MDAQTDTGRMLERFYMDK